MTGAQMWLWMGWTLAAAGAVVCALALFRDRAKGRRRCPKCWYDMSGAVGAGVGAGEGVRCPECGAVAKSERALTRTHRRWGWVVIGVVLMLLAYPAGQEPLLRAGTWREAVPTWVIVYLWPLDFDAWEKGGEEPMVDELVDNRLGSPIRNIWAARRTVAKMQSLPREGGQGPDYEYGRDTRAVDISPYWEALGRGKLETYEGWNVGGSHMDGMLSGTRARDYLLASDSKQIMYELSEIAISTVQPDGWVENGGEDGRVRMIGPYLTFEGPMKTVEDAASEVHRLAEYAALIKSSPNQPPVQLYNHEGLSVRAYPTSGLLPAAVLDEQSEDDRVACTKLLADLSDLIAGHIGADKRQWYLGDVGVVFAHERTGLLIIRHRPEVHAQIERYLKSLEGTRWWDPPQAAGDGALSPK